MKETKNAVNYDKMMTDTVAKIDGRPRLYLHSCCAPCSTSCILRLNPFFRLTVVYYNPNIDSTEEYEKRANEQIKFVQNFDKSIEYKIAPYDHGEFLKAVQGLESQPERGMRCDVCYRLRLDKCASFCCAEEYFATTLTLSPLKSAEKINQIGKQIGLERGVNYLPSDFKKQNGYLRSLEMSNQYALYRQNYCGCEFSRPLE